MRIYFFSSGNSMISGSAEPSDVADEILEKPDLVIELSIGITKDDNWMGRGGPSVVLKFNDGEPGYSGHKLGTDNIGKTILEIMEQFKTVIESKVALERALQLIISLGEKCKPNSEKVQVSSDSMIATPKDHPDGK